MSKCKQEIQAFFHQIPPSSNGDPSWAGEMVLQVTARAALTGPPGFRPCNHLELQFSETQQALLAPAGTRLHMEHMHTRTNTHFSSGLHMPFLPACERQKQADLSVKPAWSTAGGSQCLYVEGTSTGQWWCTLLFPAPGRQRHSELAFEASLVYTETLSQTTKQRK